MQYPEVSQYVKEKINELANMPETCYYGNILKGLSLVESPSLGCEFAVSPEGELKYNPSTPSLLHRETTRTYRDLLHEASHIALEHFARKEFMGVTGVNHTYFNIAADCTAEHLLDQDFPQWAGDPKHHAGLEQYVPRSDWGVYSTEELYIRIKQPDDANDTSNPDPDHLPSLTPEARSDMNNVINSAKTDAEVTIIDALIDNAAINTKNKTKGRTDIAIPASQLEAIRSKHKINNLSSLDALQRLFTKTYGKSGEKEDASTFSQNNLLRRTFLGNPLIGRKQALEVEEDGQEIKWHNDLVAYVDVSGSMSRTSIINAFHLLVKLAKEYEVEPIKVHTYNGDIVETFYIDSLTDMSTLKFRIGGGTNINRSIRSCPPDNKLVFILTDMQDDPITHWPYEGKLIWLVHDNHKTNFHNTFYLGEIIYINDILGGN